MKRLKFYVPGMISLLGLPVLLFFLGPRMPDKHTCMRVYLPSEAPDTPSVLRFNRADVLRRLRHKKVVSVALDEHPSSGMTEGVLYRRSGFVLMEMARLQFTHDTSEVLEVSFGEGNTYGDFVWAYNNAVVFNFKRYVYFDNSLYFWAQPPPQRMKVPIEPLVPPDNIIMPNLAPKKEPTELELIGKTISWQWAGVIEVIRHNYLLTAGVMVLILIPGVWWIIRLWR